MKKCCLILCCIVAGLPTNAQSRDSIRHFKKLQLKPLVDTKEKHIPQLVKPDFYNQHLGFFCRQELKVEKAIKIPIKIRLGSNEQCSFLEQKTAYKLPSPLY